MTLRDPQDTVESLRAMLQKLEMSADPGEDQASKAELKRILLHRIAELEVLKALELPDSGETDRPAADALVPPASIAADAENQDADPDQPNTNPLEKLD